MQPSSNNCYDTGLREECGVFGIYDLDGADVSPSIYYGLSALQHRGQESCGIAVSDTSGPKGHVKSYKGLGLVNEVFKESILGSLANGQKVIIEDGVAKMPDRSAFAGSVATTNRLVRTMVQLANVSLINAIRMMTLTPARILHIDKSKGSLESGKDADIVIFDNQINIIHTISEGHVIYSK